ncbi:hypothetical protein ACFW2X_02615 [Streptomyces antibioticus]|uniref:hypothetical protein n=1 Tax=Streptomyces antibioticus TaxID=1890 RepID=UPI0036A97073
MELLRYGDDLVTVSPSGAGSLIETEDHRSGYRRHSRYLYDRRREDVRPSTLRDPAVLEYVRHEWDNY